MQSRLMLFLMVIAVILAIAGFLLIRFLLTGPSETPPLIDGQPGVEQPGGQDPAGAPLGDPVPVGDSLVYLTVNPDRIVRLRTEAAPPVQQPTQPVVPQPTETLVPQPTQPPLLQPTAAPPAAPVAGPAVGIEPIIFIQYTVVAGDTLYQITRKQNTSIELMAERGIDAEDLVPGNVLNLPIANPNYCINSRPYVVEPGDTVFSVAYRSNTTKEAIASLNNLGADYRIDIANVICVP